VDIDEDTVETLNNDGRNIIRGSATDPEFWSRVNLNFDRVRLILLAMPNTQENLFAASQLKGAGYAGKLAAIAKYGDEVEALQHAGVHAAYNLYAEAGSGFAEHVCNELLPKARIDPDTIR